jgi:asparagine synthase (glutamine-hydrolysing)
VPSYAIAALTRQYVTVALNGDGGDENFAGYDRYITDRLVSHGDSIPLPIWRQLTAAIHYLPASWRHHLPLRKVVQLATLLTQRPERRYARWGEHFTLEERQSLYSDAFRHAVSNSDPDRLFADVFEQSDAEDRIDAVLNADVNLYLADDLLVKIDRASMAHSLEARSPLLDHVLMEFVASLPPHFKLAGAQKKRILKAALRGLIPDVILDRPKMGFCVPLARWFREDLREMAYDVLLSPRALQRSYFEPKAIAGLLNAHCRGQADHALQLWDLLVLELWHRCFIDGEPSVDLGKSLS